MPKPPEHVPHTDGETKIRSPKRSAAGIPAILKTVRYARREMGIVKGTRALLKVNKVDGYDCQSCAWPSPDEHRHVAEFCENGAKAVADEATTKRITPEFFQQYSVAQLAEQHDHWLNDQGRLTHPMLLRKGATHYEPITWDDAFALIARELNALASPNEAIFYTSGRTSNEAAFLYQLFVRQFGTNNMPDCSNMCHESSGAALNPTIGIGKGTVKLEDFYYTDAIFILGQNPGTNHPRMLSALQAAKNNGAKIVSINPLPEAGLMKFKNPQQVFNTLGKGTRIADVHVQLRINGDIAVLKGIVKEMLAAEEASGGVIDWDFIKARTVGVDEYLADIRATSWDEIIEQSGVTREKIRDAAAVAMNANSIICCWAMGLTQHPNAVATIQSIVNFLLLRGNIGRRGAGACPVRGHSNVQGDRTVGIWEKPTERFLDALEKEFNFAPPREHGFDTVDSIKAMHDGRAKVFFAMGGNFLSATPDTDFTAEALRKCRLTVHVSTKLNRAHLIHGDQALILPCLGRSEIDRQRDGEQFVTTEDSMGVINPSRGVFEPGSPQLKSEPAIVAGLAKATLGARSNIDWDALVANYDRIRDAIEHVVPGFENYNTRIRKGPFYLPNGPREGEFKTADGKAHFTVHPIWKHDLNDGELVMMTIRSHDQFNTTIYGLDDRYRGIYDGRRVVFMNRDDVKVRGLKQGDSVDIISTYNGRTRVAEAFKVVPFSIPPKCCATYFPEANVLVPIDSVAAVSNTPASKYVKVVVEKRSTRNAQRSTEKS